MNGEHPRRTAQQAADANRVLRQEVTVVNPQGLHMRPAAAFAKVARQFASEVTVSLNGKSVNGKSPLDLLLLAAEAGARLTVEVSGADAERALPALTEALADPASPEMDD